MMTIRSVASQVDECGWTNPGRREGVDKIDWRRITGRDALAPHTDHTLRSERGYLLQLTYADPQRPGEFAWLVSPSMEGSERPRCLTFRSVLSHIQVRTDSHLGPY